MIEYRYILDMVPGSIPVIVPISQYDNDFTIIFTLHASEGTFTVESGTTAAIKGSKTDGNGYSATAALNISQKTVTITGNKQMTACYGKQIFELTLTKNNKELSTANFILDVEKAPLDKDTLPSESVIRELVDVMDYAEDIIAAAQTIREYIDFSASGITDNAKQLILSLLGKCAYSSADAQADINNLRAELFGTSPEDPAQVVGIWGYGVWSNYNEGQITGNIFRRPTATRPYSRSLYLSETGTHELESDGSADGYYPIPKPSGAMGIRITKTGSDNLYISVNTLFYNTETEVWNRVTSYGFTEIGSGYTCTFDDVGTHIFLNCKLGSSGNVNLTEEQLNTISAEWIY